MFIKTSLTVAGAIALALCAAPLSLAQQPATAPAPSTATTPPTASASKTATPAATMVSHASSAEITQAQQALVKLGHNISVDGRMGPATRNALIDFQKTNGLSQTGRLDTNTKRGLGLIGGQPPAGYNLSGYTTAAAKTAPVASSGAAPSQTMPPSSGTMMPPSSGTTMSPSASTY